MNSFVGRYQQYLWKTKNSSGKVLKVMEERMNSMCRITNGDEEWQKWEYRRIILNIS